MNCIKELCKNHLKINYVEFCMQAENIYLCFYKNSTNHIFTFTSSKGVYFKTHLGN